MEVIDKRKERTEKLIRGVYFELLAEMPAFKITVSELCRRANINRGTFYLHYQDCYDLTETLSREIADRLNPHVEAICRDRGNLQSSITSILPILAEDKNVARLVQTSDLCRQTISRHFRAIIQHNWKRLSTISDAQADLIYAYICGGIFAAIQAIGEAAESDLYESIYRIINDGLSAFVSGQ